MSFRSTELGDLFPLSREIGPQILILLVAPKTLCLIQPQYPPPALSAPLEPSPVSELQLKQKNP